jgi:hypothetical protein
MGTSLMADLFEITAHGGVAYRNGEPMKSCPWPLPPESTAWCRGWLGARDQYDLIAKRTATLQKIRSIIETSLMANSIQEGAMTINEVMAEIDKVIE